MSQVANLFARDEMDEILGELVPIMKKEFPRRPPSNENLYEYYLSRVRNNLHVTLCFSPVGLCCIQNQTYSSKVFSLVELKDGLHACKTAKTVNLIFWTTSLPNWLRRLPWVWVAQGSNPSQIILVTYKQALARHLAHWGQYLDWLAWCTQWLGEIASLILNFWLSMTACNII